MRRRVRWLGRNGCSKGSSDGSVKSSPDLMAICTSAPATAMAGAARRPMTIASRASCPPLDYQLPTTNHQLTGTVAGSGLPALDVDVVDAANRRRRTSRADADAAVADSGRDAHAAADRNPLLVVLTFFHQAGDPNHLAFMRFDVVAQFPRRIHPQMNPFGNVRPADLIFCPRSGREHRSFGATGHGDAH